MAGLLTGRKSLPCISNSKILFMAVNIQLADRLREYLAEIPGSGSKKKKMFRGMAFMVNGEDV